MRILDAFISFIFSIVVLVLAISVILVLTGFVSSNVLTDLINTYVFGEEYYNIVLITSIFTALAALKTTIFLSRFKSKDNTPILVETDHGNVEIAQETITNTVKSIAIKMDNVKDVNAKMTKKKNGIKVYAVISVLANTNIRELTDELQTKVIEIIKETTGVNVLSVNIKVKNIYEKGSKVEKAAQAVKTEVVPQVEPKTIEEVEQITFEEPIENSENVNLENDEKKGE